MISFFADSIVREGFLRLQKVIIALHLDRLLAALHRSADRTNKFFPSFKTTGITKRNLECFSGVNVNLKDLKKDIISISQSLWCELNRRIPAVVCKQQISSVHGSSLNTVCS